MIKLFLLLLSCQLLMSCTANKVACSSCEQTDIFQHKCPDPRSGVCVICNDLS